MKRAGNIVWGILFILVGGIFALNALGITEINVFFKGWWTLFIIVPSFVGLIKNDNKMWSFVWLLIGIALLLGAQGILQFSLLRRLMIPVIFILIGLSIIFKDTVNSKVNQKIHELNKDGLPEYYATFSGQKVQPKGEVFEGASLNAIFGGVEVDLREAVIEKDQIINATAVFGGIDIHVSDKVNVKVKSTPIFGGVSNKTNHVTGENIPTIYINAFCLFGGVDIK